MQTTSTRRPVRSDTTRPKKAQPPNVLAMLAANVRGARQHQGMTRRVLAERSGVSERHLAQVESGAGNISVKMLAKVALALGMAMTDLLREGAPRRPEIDLIQQQLEGLPDVLLRRLHQDLVQTHAQAARQRRHRIALVGLRGGGKTTLGGKLARHLRAPFVELDREVEREAGTRLNEIFLLYGQAGFRRYEKRCLEHVLNAYPRVVIATGGSIVTEPATFELLLASCYTVWIKASAEEHMARVVAQGDLRPMQGNDQSMLDLRRILALREPLYQRADATLDTAHMSVEHSARDLIKCIEA